MTERRVDVLNRPCPIPIIEVAKALREMAEGELLILRGTDPSIPADLKAFCAATGHTLETLEIGTIVEARVRKRTNAAYPAG